eukprot:TRINITY_DN5678_c0_g1_i2.p1 TRINITY_DN5678_c0_g1~~TRINITY_DN5678_c0_g1_i2.p1  ORF type:complete len:475 (+),score=98.01 TRINITY_DN5678_c0_g1_i2:51-1475(+)
MPHVVAREYIGGRLVQSYWEDSATSDREISTDDPQNTTNSPRSSNDAIAPQSPSSNPTKRGGVIRVQAGSARFSVKSLLYDAFLPRGYPATVTDDYKMYQICDSLQALCSSVTGVFAGRAMLKAAGVGNADATAGAAILNWMIRDGTSMIGRVLFTYLYASNLDSNCKTWRFLADIMNDAALFLELISPFIFSNLYLPVVCTAGLLKTLCGLTGGATKAALTQHFALKDNLADVNAKDGSQETAVNLLGIMLGFVVSSLVSEDDLLASIILFIFFTTFHLYFNYRAVQAIKMRVLNRQRLNTQIKHYFRSDAVFSREDIRQREKIIWFDCRKPPIYLGSSLSSIGNISSPGLMSEIIQSLRASRFYIHITHVKHTRDHTRHVLAIHVLLHPDVDQNSLLRAYFEALLIRYHHRFNMALLNADCPDHEFPGALRKWARLYVDKHISIFLEKLQHEGWKTDRFLLEDTDCRIIDAE